MKKFLIVSLCISIIGCASGPIKQTGSVDVLQYGMPKGQMVNSIGKPDSIEIYKKSDDSRVEFYIYGRTPDSKDKVPVCLIDNKVVGWGKTFYEDHLTPELTRIK